MRATTLLRTLLALKRTRVTAVEFTAFGIDIRVAPRSRVPYCSACLRRDLHPLERQESPESYTTGFIDGDIDEVRLYGAGLTAAQIKIVMQQ